MKHSHGNLITTILPVLVLASVAASGWYSYYTEADKNQSLATDSRSQQEKLNNELEKLQSSVNKLQKDESELQAKLVSEIKSQENLQATINKLLEGESELKAKLELEKDSQQQQTALLEKTMAEKAMMETSLQQEVTRIVSTTEELEAELERRQAAQKSLHEEISDVSGEKSRLLSQLEQEQLSSRKITNLKDRLERELDESRVQISQMKNQMTVIKLNSEILFSSGSAEIKSSGQKVLSIIAESLNAYPHRAISVEGHTDNVPVVHNTRYESNWALSAARGLAAVNYFQQNNRVDPKRLKVVGYGEYRPVSSNDTAEGRQRNRRIEIRMMPPEISEVIQK